MRTFSKREFSHRAKEIQKAAQIEPVLITQKGKPILVVISHNDYLRLSGKYGRHESAADALIRYSGCPIFRAQSVYPFEFPQIIADQHQSQAAGMAGNHRIISADRPAGLLQRGTDLGGVQGSLR